MLHRPSDQERRLIYEEEKARKQNTGTKCGSNSLLPERKVQGTAKKSVAGTSGTIGLRCVCVCVCTRFCKDRASKFPGNSKECGLDKGLGSTE